MKKETLQNLLHTYFPDWDNSICQGREKLGFSFSLNTLQRRGWFVSNKHVEVKKYAEAEVINLHLPQEMSMYWVCCFYSNYQYGDGSKNLTEVKGTPFLELPCPSSTLGKSWEDSIDRARRAIMKEHNLKDDGDLALWFWNLEEANELGNFALKETNNLHLPDYYAMAWVCCFLPKGAKYMASRSASLLKRFPQFSYRQEFVCTGENPRTRVRAYPFGIDWAEGADEKYRKTTTMWDLQERGIILSTEYDASGNIRMTLGWQPELVRINELRQAVGYAQRYYRERMKSAQSSPLHHLISSFIHRAKVIPVDQRKKSAEARYASGKATFEELLCEEAITPEVQKRYKEYKLVYHKSPARRSSALKDIRRIRKDVYDRVRSWLIDTETSPRVVRGSQWWSDVLPNPQNE